MQNEGRLYSQVAAEAKVPIEKAMIACYLVNLARAGKSLDEAAALLRKDRHEARGYARDWGISFSDYTSSEQPLRLAWTKAARGRWVLKFDGVEVAEAVSDGAGGYKAYRLSERAGPPFFGSNAEVAMRRLSLLLEHQAVEVFGVDDVAICVVEPNGATSRLAPKITDNVSRLRGALAAA